MTMMKHEMGDALVNRILLCAMLIAGISGLVLLHGHIFPASMLVDCASAGLFAALLLCRAKISTQNKLVWLVMVGLIIALTAIVQNPYAPDGYMVIGGVVAISFANWSGVRALLIPALAVAALMIVTLLLSLNIISIDSQATQAQNTPEAWLIVALTMVLLSIGIGGAIHELKTRLFKHIFLLEAANQRLESYAFNDENTGLGNERYLEQRVDADLDAGTKGCLLMLKLTGMDLYHAIYGHKKHGEVLQKIARALQAGLREADVLAKLNGPQFAIWSPDCADSDRLYRAIEQRLEADLTLARYGIVARAVAVVAPHYGEKYSALMKHLHLVISMAPGDGFSGCLHFTADMERQIKARLALKERIRLALDSGGFYPVYQAKVNSHTHTIAGFEGLARMVASDDEVPPGPGIFIPVLHEEGWMAEFGMLMLRHVIADIPEFSRRFGADIKIAANVSPPLFLFPEFAIELAALLSQAKVDPRALIIEITEEVFANDIDIVKKVCRDLQELGVQISLDDFGSGFSSLSFLQSMNFDEIKVDQSFVRNLERDEKSFLLLSSICKLGEDLQCRVVVEGVESAAQLGWVEQTHCAQIQGFLFARPQAVRDIVAAIDAGGMVTSPA